MRNIFNLDNKLFQTLEKIGDFLLLNLLWLVFSIPIVTIGSASTALYYTVRKYFRDQEGSLWNTYWYNLKSNFKQGTFLWLIFMIMFLFIGFSTYLSYKLGDTIPFMRAFCILILLVLAFAIVWSVYCFAYISHIEDGLGAVMRNCLLISVVDLKYSLLLLAGLILCVTLLLFLPIGPLLLCVLPAGYAYLETFILDKVFSKYWNIGSENNEQS